jgi:hypothetical protein
LALTEGAGCVSPPFFIHKESHHERGMEFN